MIFSSRSISALLFLLAAAAPATSFLVGLPWLPPTGQQLRSGYYYLSSCTLEIRTGASGVASAVGLQMSSDSFENDSDDDENDFPSFMPPPPPNNGLADLPGMMAPPNKGGIYSDNELMELLQLHENLADTVAQPSSAKKTQESILLPGEQPGNGPSLHDLVLQTLAQDENNGIEEENVETADPVSILLPGEKRPETGGLSLHEMVLKALEEGEEMDDDDNSQFGTNNEDLDQRISNIIAIASDVDGTLLSSQHDLHPRTADAIRKAVQQVQTSDSIRDRKKLQFFFPATGKTRKGALDSLGPEMRDLLYQLPGVFIQGLYVIGPDGSLIFEQRLPSDAIRKAEELGETWALALIGYDGDDLYTNIDTDFAREISTKWGEPMPLTIPSLSKHPNGFNKILLMDPNVDKLINKVRPELELLAKKTDTTVTQAIPTMLELLPAGCSKDKGVEKLCKALGIDPGKQLLAIGDAENDIGMLKMAAIGVAVSNACDAAKKSADVVLEESNDDGGAGAAMEKYSPLRNQESS